MDQLVDLHDSVTEVRVAAHVAAMCEGISVGFRFAEEVKQLCFR
jgi:hypothetical protein